MSLDVIFATIVGVLAGLAVIGALVFALVWEWCAIQRTLAAHRRPPAEERFWRDRAALDPGAGGVRTAACWLLVDWLVAALVLLGMEGAVA
jgi:hypothetical protein